MIWAQTTAAREHQGWLREHLIDWALIEVERETTKKSEHIRTLDTIQSNQTKPNQVKSSQVKSNPIKSRQNTEYDEAFFTKH